MASKTARDVGEELTFLPIGTLPTHKLEDLRMEDYNDKLDKIPVEATYVNPEGPEWLPPAIT